MPTELKMPALSPTMEEGTLAKWLVKEGDTVSSGDILAEIETDKATMEFEAVDEGTIGKILVGEGTDGVKVGTAIAILLEEGEDASAAAAPVSKTDSAPAAAPTPEPEVKGYGSNPAEDNQIAQAPAPGGAAPVRAEQQSTGSGNRIKASPLARRLAEHRGVDLSSLKGSGPGGRIVKADLEGAASAPEATAPATPSAAASPAAPAQPTNSDIPHEAEKLSNMRKTIARRLSESKQTVPHIYLTVDINLDPLLKLRSQLNASLEARRVKLSVNDLLIKALAVSLIQVPECNVQYTGDQLLKFSRADISVAVSIPSGLITPIIVDASNKGVAGISTEMKDLAGRAREGKLNPQEYTGGTASLSNMGMYGIKQFEAIINPPQGMIMAIGAGEKRPYVVNDSLQIATVMSATGSFDHRAIDGADGAKLMQAFKQLVENPLGMLA